MAAAPQILDPSDSSDGSDSDVDVRVEEMPQVKENASMDLRAPAAPSHEDVGDAVCQDLQERREVAPISDGSLDEEPVEVAAPMVKPRTSSKEEGDECRRFWEGVGFLPPGLRHKLAQIRALVKIVVEKFEEIRGFASRPADAVVVGVFQAAMREMVGQSLESRLDASEDDLRRLAEMSPEVMSGLKLGEVLRCHRLAKTLASMANEQMVSSKKNGKKRSAGEASVEDNVEGVEAAAKRVRTEAAATVGEASFKDKIEGMEAAAKRVKTELAAMVGRKGLELGWFDAPDNLKHMTVVDVEAFKSFFEETLEAFKADPTFQGIDVMEKFGKILLDVDKTNSMDALFVKKHGKGFDVLRGDHQEYRSLVKAEWLRRMRAA
jgi:hypothetical protein